MNDQIRAIAQRLKGLREALDLSIEQVAQSASISPESYQGYESGEQDIPVSLLQCISKEYQIEMTALLFGEEAHMSSYFLTRNQQGVAIERTKFYKYQSLAAGFKQRLADPFIVTVEPKAADTPMHLNTHPGQEFNYILEGRLLLRIGEKELILQQGDSIYFDSQKPHGMKALDDKSVRFLAIIL